MRRRFDDANNPDSAETTKTDPPRLSIGDIGRLLWDLWGLLLGENRGCF